MKIFIIIFILTFQTFSSFSQDTNQTENAGYYESLLRNGDSCNRNNIDMLIGIYEKENKTSELKRTLERSIACPLGNFMQLSHYWQLADIYYQESKYQKSLQMIRLALVSKTKVKTPHNPYPQVANLELALNLSRNYKGLQEIDSSIYALTPLVFYKYSYFEGFYDSIAYENILGTYLNLLRTKYSKMEIKAALGKADASFYYSDIVDKKSDTLGCVHHKVDCGFPFFNYNVKYLDMDMIYCPNNAYYQIFGRLLASLLTFVCFFCRSFGSPIHNCLKWFEIQTHLLSG